MVTIDPVILNPFVVECMVRKLTRPRINRSAPPPIALTAEVDPVKFALGAGWVTECKDHALAVRQPSLRYVKDDVRHGTRFIENIETRRVRRVLPRECFRVFFPAGLRCAKPRLRRTLVIQPRG